MRKRLLAIDIFSSCHGVDNDLLVPVVRHRYDDRVNFFVVEQFLVPARGRNRLAYDFPGQFVAAMSRGDANSGSEFRSMAFAASVAPAAPAVVCKNSRRENRYFFIM